MKVKAVITEIIMKRGWLGEYDRPDVEADAAAIVRGLQKKGYVIVKKVDVEEMKELYEEMCYGEDR